LAVDVWRRCLWQLKAVVLAEHLESGDQEPARALRVDLAAIGPRFEGHVTTQHIDGAGANRRLRSPELVDRVVDRAFGVEPDQRRALPGAGSIELHGDSGRIGGLECVAAGTAEFVMER